MVSKNICSNQKSVTWEQFFCVGLGSICYFLCFDLCLQTYVLRKIETARFEMKHEIINFYPLQVCYVKYKHESYVMIHVIKQDMDPNSNVNYRRKIGPMTGNCTIFILFHFRKTEKEFHANEKAHSFYCLLCNLPKATYSLFRIEKYTCDM